MSKALFITTVNIMDTRGNGGTKLSVEHLHMIQQYFGADNVKVCIFCPKPEMQDGLDSAYGSSVTMFEKETSSLRLLAAALFGCRVYMPWREKELYTYIDNISPDVLFLDFSVLGRIMRRKSSYKTVVFFHNIEADYTYNKMKHEGIVYYPAFIAAKKNDKWAAKADRVVCLNERDASRMRDLYGREADIKLPITLEDTFKPEKAEICNLRAILFVGSMFGPNQDGIEWFIDNVMPGLDNIKLVIVGNGFEKKKKLYERKGNISVIGSVDSQAEYYYKYPAVVMPIRYGAGMKVKTAEAMMFGRHIFASDESLEGYQVAGVEGIERCNTSSEYIAAINQYFSINNTKGYEEQVRNLFLMEYETGVGYKKFKQMMDKLL